MHSHTLDNYAHIDSPIHRLPPVVKGIAVLATIVGLVVLPPSPVLFGVGGFLLVMALAASNIPASFVVKRMRQLEPFVLGIALFTLLGPHGGMRFLIIVSRTTLCILAMVLFANTSRFSDQLQMLRVLRVPALMIMTLALMYRYLFVLKDESARMSRARASRTFSRQAHRAKWAHMGSLIAQLFLRTTRRAERVYAAMCARGWR